jgi:hypothetical protein
MNALEQFAVMVILQVLNMVIKDAAHKAALQGTLLGLANDIYAAYGMIPPTASVATTGTTAT